MQTKELKQNLYYVGVIDKELRLFDVAIRTDYGTSYNSYLLRTREGVVVFEGSKEGFLDEYLSNIRSIIGDEPIKYLIVSHTEPDHSGAIKDLLNVYPDLTIIASASAHLNLSKILRKPYKRVDAKPETEMTIGEYTFRFVSGSFMHWPDVVFTYIKELKTLVSCDAFGCHYAPKGILLSEEKDREDYEKALKYYYDHIMGPFPNQVIAACRKVETLDIDLICCGHGPVVDCDVKETINKYVGFAAPSIPSNDKNRVLIIYSSAYGYTRKIAKSLQNQLEKAEKTVICKEIDVLNYSNVKEDLIKEIRKAGTLLLGSPTINNDAIVLYYDLLSSIPANIGVGKKASAFGDYGWSGEAVPNLLSRLKQLRFNVFDGVRINFELDEKGEAEIKEFVDRVLA